VLNFSRAGNVGAPGVDGAETSVNIQVFTSSDTYTPTVGMNYCIAEAQAPSGGGGGADRSTGAQPAAAAGGGGGEYRRGVFSAAEIGAGVTVTINAPGTAGNANGGNGGNGGTVTFGALMTANGGSGGLGTGQPASGVASYLPGGAGGTGGSGGQLAIPGGQGGMGVNVSSGQWIAGNGGWSMLGGVTTPNHNSSDAVGTTGKNYGSGGSGAVSADGTGSIGGVGGPGCAIITEYIA
jgi:hypothetical protein